MAKFVLKFEIMCIQFLAHVRHLVAINFNYHNSERSRVVTSKKTPCLSLTCVTLVSTGVTLAFEIQMKLTLPPTPLIVGEPESLPVSLELSEHGADQF